MTPPEEAGLATRGLTVADWQTAVWSLMQAKGFHDGRRAGRDDTLVRLCLLHSEVTEAVQIVKREWPTSVGLSPQGIPPGVKARFGEELADVAIRLLDLAQCCEVDLAGEIAAKHRKNAQRPNHYGTPKEGQ